MFDGRVVYENTLRAPLRPLLSPQCQVLEGVCQRSTSMGDERIDRWRARKQVPETWGQVQAEPHTCQVRTEPDTWVPGSTGPESQDRATQTL
jgi:hypothetical protein